MKIHEMLPGLDSDALATVHTNAVRLSTNGTPKQKEQALAALDLIAAEMARREAELPPKKPAKAKRADKDTTAAAPKKKAARAS